MNLYGSNLFAWSLQIAIIVALCSFPTWPLLRLPVSRAQLWYWHIVLLISLALPLLQPWIKPASAASAVTFTTGQFRLAATPQPTHFAIHWPVVALAVLSSGIALRLLWLSLGLLRLRRYRATALPLAQADDSFTELRLAIAPQAEILISENVASPVTFGVLKPVILLPGRFSALSREERASIVCHELIHIQRRDWAFSIAEELVRAIFWFHPAIWWLLGRIQLTREQVVDQEVIRQTGDRNHYLDALLTIASLQISADLAPAPLFLKKRHLRQRVESIVSGVAMTKRNLLLPLAAAFATLPVAIWVAAGQFPLRAAPQEAVDDPGVEVQLGAGKLLHRTGIAYPDEARIKNISGTVVVQLTLNDKGEVSDAVALSGPQELRKSVLQSVLNWHFSEEAGASPDLQIAVHFDTGHETAGGPDAAKKAAIVARRIALVQAQSGITDPEKFHQWVFEQIGITFEDWKRQMTDSVSANLQRSKAPPDTRPRTIETVNLDMLPPVLREKVTQSGVLKVGSTLSPDGIGDVGKALREVDDHLRFGVNFTQDKVRLTVLVAGQEVPSNRPRPGDPFNLLPAIDPPQTIRVGGNLQAANILLKVRPKYPPEAKQARIQGTVRLTATIGSDGLVKNLEVVSGAPELVGAALEAVQQWVYKPTLLNGNPVAVITTIDINFTLQQ